MPVSPLSFAMVTPIKMTKFNCQELLPTCLKIISKVSVTLMSSFLRHATRMGVARHGPRTCVLPASQVVQQPAIDHTAEVEGTITENPLAHEDFFGVNQLVNMRELFDARVHIGHKSGVRHPHMRPYLFGTRLGVDIIDLTLTVTRMRAALNFTAHIASRNGIILFVSAGQQTLPLVEKAATSCGEYAHCRRWRGGTFTNATRLYGAVTRLPDLCIFIGTHDALLGEHIAVVESAKLNIATTGIVDTSADPRLISYPVAGNDDTPRAIALYCRLFAEAVRRGKTWSENQRKNDSNKQTT